ncbi:MAG TPA: outer membrane lipoprotein chaperone LolA [Acidobacteriota bacterium]|nr:outer membrane lipoprotein chaperone LolA [Acidobacteriota bacterium]
MKIVAILLALFLNTAQLDPATVAERVQLVYDGASALRCEFIQLYRSGTTGKVTEAGGELRIKKPGKMRWDYLSPDKQLYVSNGKNVYWYLPEDRQVTRMSLEEADQQQTQILFLTGRGDILRDFEVTREQILEALYDESFLIRLTPKREEQFDYLVLEINPSDFYVERMVVFDAFGNSTDYRFINIRPAELSDSEFEFTIPRGVEVFEGK